MQASRKDQSLASSSVVSQVTPESRLLLVGIVAGAGGTSAVKELLAGLGDNLSMAIVLMMDITHQALLGDLLPTHCQWPTVEVSEPVAPQAGCLYLPALGCGLELVEGILRPVANEQQQHCEDLLDRFLVSLAKTKQVDRIGVMLAGDGTAGAHGLRAISTAGGITFAQDPQTTKRAGMPRAAASLGLADRLLSSSAIAAELVAYQRFESQQQEVSVSASFEEQWSRMGASFCDQLAKQTDYDFRNVDAAWMQACVSRRLLLNKLATLDAYLTQLQSQPTECLVLARELTRQGKFWFCDSGLLRTLEERVLPGMIRRSNLRESLRCWVPACGNGEEAYSLAMLACEHLERANLSLNLQIFATERSTNSIAIARTGIYPSDIEQYVSAERLQRFFELRSGLCCVNSAIRERVLFSVHDVVRDPPFAKLDLIVCRGLLAYLSLDLQHQVLDRFHFALRSGGFLLLGPNDGHALSSSLFSCVDDTQSVWQRRDVSRVRRNWHRQPQQSPSNRGLKQAHAQSVQHDDLLPALQHRLLSEFTPQSVVVDSQGKVICTSSASNDFMKIQDGIFENNIYALIIPSLRLCLRSALAEVTASRQRVVHDNLVVPKGGVYLRVKLTVQPFEHHGQQDDMTLIVFEVMDEALKKDPVDPVKGRSGEEGASAEEESLELVKNLENQLTSVRQNLLQSLQEMEATNEELIASNEELLSINEELQATNEELEASKEELKSHRDALAQAHNDQANLLRCSQVATIFLDLDLKIRDFSPSCAEYYNIVAGDRGRSLNDLKPRIKEMPPLPDPAHLFVESKLEETFTGEFGKAYLRRMLPYLSAEGEVNGVVINFVEVTHIKASQEILSLSLRAANMFAFAMNIETGSLCRQGSVCETLGLPEEDTFESSLQRIHVDDRLSLRRALSAVTPESPYYHLTYRLKLPSGVDVWLREDAKVFFATDGTPQRCVGSCREVTEEKNREIRLLESEQRLASALDASSDGSWDWNIETGEVQYSDQWLRNLGYQTQEVAANISFWQSIVHPDDYEHTQAELQKHLKGETDVCYCENRVRTKSGAYRWNLIRGRVIERTPDGKAMRMVATDTDITKRKQYEQEIVDREAHLRRVIDKMLCFVGVLDTKGTLLEVNERAIAAGGLSRDQVLGKKFWECPWWNYDPQVADELKHAYHRALAGESVRYDATVKMKNETLMAVDFMMAPIFNNDGKIAYVIPSGLDVSERRRAERALAESRQRLDMAMQAASMGAFEWEPLTGRVFQDNVVQGLFGLAADKSVGGPEFMKLVHHEDVQGVQNCIDDAVKYGRPFYAEFRVVRPDGKVRWLAARGKRVEDDQSESSPKIVGLNWDITEAKEQAERIRANEQRLRLAMSAAKLALWQWNVKRDRIEWSRELETGRGAYVTQPLGSIADFYALVHPDDRFDVEHALNSCLGTGDPYQIEFRIRNPEGDYRWVMSTAQLICDSDGSPSQLLGIELDITERKHAELSLRLNEERLRLAAEAAGFGAFHFDLNAQRASCSTGFHRLLRVNDLVADILEPFDLLRYAHPDDQGYFREHLSAITLGEIEWSAGFDFRVPAEDGSTRWLRLQHKTLFQGDHEERRPTQIIGTLLDITGQRNFEEKLEAARQAAEVANASKSEFLANMSHEIRTPMTAVLGYAQLVAERIQDPEAQGYLATIQRNGEFLLEIINDILDLSKIEAGKLEVNPERFSPGRLVSDVRSVMEVRAREKNLDLQVEYVGEIPAFITSDAKRLKQILINLVGNAIKFTQQGQVRVIVRHLDNGESKLAFEVVDTGIGMTAAQQQRLFQPFSQGDASISRAFGGTGLGLVISQRLARMLGGEIEVESSPERGSRFMVTIATGDVQSEQLVGPVVAESSAAPLMPGGTIRPGCRVLVVDDRRDIRLLAEKLLQKLGVTTEAAEDGLQAVAKVSEALTNGQVFHLVLLDMQMPKLDGYQTAEELRELGFANPILALTADAMQGDMNRCIACGCNDYLSKPIDARLLAQKVYQLTKTLED